MEMLTFVDIIDSSFRLISAHGSLVNTENDVLAFNYIFLKLISSLRGNLQIKQEKNKVQVKTAWKINFQNHSYIKL